MNRIRSVVVLLGLCCAIQLSAQNPIKMNSGMSDPHVRVYNDTVYLFTGNDESPETKKFDMRYWKIYSTVDLVNWEKVGTISPKDNYMPDNTQDCWAGDATTRNGKYYFYFSDQKRGVGVMVADKPEGTYIDALGKPLVAPMHDPTIFIEDDAEKTPYMVYGDKAGGGFHVVRLNEDMISVAETPKPIVINGKEWEDAPEWQDKNYIFKYNHKYYLSWGGDYAVSENLYGPYQCAGSVGSGYELGKYAHGSFFWWKGQFYHVWCYYLVPGLKYRETIITYCHFNKESEIVTDTRFLDQHFSSGVGQYSADWDKIEAEWYYEVSEGIEKKDLGVNNFAISLPKNDDWVRFAKVNFNGKHNEVSICAKSKSKGSIELRKGSVDGEILSTIAIRNTKGKYETLSAKMNGINGIEDLCLVYKTKKNDNVELDWIKF